MYRAFAQRLLTVTGVLAPLAAACGGSGPSVQAPVEPGARADAGAEPSSAEATTAPKPRPTTCGADQVLRVMCGDSTATRLPEGEAKCRSMAEMGELHVLPRGGSEGSGEEYGRRRKIPDDLRYDANMSALYNDWTKRPGGCCMSQCVPFGRFGAPPDYGGGATHCVPAPSKTTQPSAKDPDCPENATLVVAQYGERPATLQRVERIEFPAGKACCYGPIPPGFHWRGRALRGPGGIALAEHVVGEAWSRRRPAIPLEEVSAEARAALAEVWLRDAAFEHASIASFAQLALDLVAVGAPPALVRDAHAAAIDEIAHAEASYALATHFAGRSFGPAPLDAARGRERPTLAALARDAFRDGCYGETVAVMLARASHDETTSAELRRTYRMIGDDEQRHAELSWRLLAWLVDRDAGARRAVSEELRALASDEGDALPAADALDLRAFGVLGARAEAEIRRRTIAEVVLPCARALLAGALA